MTSCTLKGPKILAAIHALAMLRPGAAKHEPYLSASLNEYSALPTRTDRSNYGSSPVLQPRVGKEVQRRVRGHEHVLDQVRCTDLSCSRTLEAR